jgi:3-hydroxy-9,10-secoandrosta-1,3,5(10)-triene-9,17-dione monooxygenase reductase component
MNVPNELNSRELRDAFGTFATGVTVITARRPDGEPIGVTANSFTSVSLSPPLALWCIARDSASAAAFADGAHFAVHVLTAAQRDVALRFATRGAEKFSTGAIAGKQGPAPNVPGALCRLDCTVEQVHPGGDHLIVVGRIASVDRRVGAPLLFHGGRFGRLEVDATSPELDLWDSFSTGWF